MGAHGLGVSRVPRAGGSRGGEVAFQARRWVPPRSYRPREADNTAIRAEAGRCHKKSPSVGTECHLQKIDRPSRDTWT